MRRASFPRPLLFVVLAVALAACGGGGGSGPADAAAPADGGAVPDAAAPDSVTPADAAAVPDAPAAPDDAAATDAAAPGDALPDPPPDALPDALPTDAAPPLPPLPLRATAAAPADPLAGAGVESCGVYLAERCAAGAHERCEVYDTAAAAFTDAPDPTLRRVLLYDRWYDLYESPGGLTAEREFVGAMPGDTPEEVWSDPANFRSWAGEGDAAIWTGAALVADAFRYLVTGTEADHARMEAKTRDLLRAFEVTGVPGYLARFHYLLVPPGTPLRDDLMMRIGTMEDRGVGDHVLADPGSIDGLPPAYLAGVPDGRGGTVAGVPMWHGHPSIDQYTGPLVGFPLVWPLLRDEALRERLVWHLTCYLKRLRRLDIVNLQSNATIRDAVMAYLGASGLRLDPDDIDLTALDRVVVYYHAGLNAANRETFDRSCPATVATEPGRVLDAAAPGFLLQMLEVAQDLGEAPGPPRPGQIDHAYTPSLRGGDASHLLHLAAMAYWFTGDEQYRRFLFETLVGDLQADRVALTAQAFRLPDWCFPYYGDHISYNTHWQLLTLLDDSPLRDTMLRVMEEEFWRKALWNHASAFFDVAYASTVPPERMEGGAAQRTAVIARAARQLRHFGGNGGTLEAPRRAHDRSRQSIVDALPEGITVRCPTEAERRACEDGGSVFGIPLDGEIISYACDGRPGECLMADGRCVEGLASEGLPVELRTYEDFLWQRNPFALGDPHAPDGHTQSPGRDFSEPYWMARYYGFLPDGAGQVLAWRAVGACE